MRSPEPDDPTFRESLDRLRQAQGVPVRPSGWRPSSPAQESEGEIHFFLSFTHTQVDHAREIAGILREEGYNVFLCDQVERPGDLQAEIVTAVQVSQRVICLLSHGYFQSQYCRRELAAFRERADADPERRVIFFDVEPGVVVPDYYRSLGRVDLSGWRRGSAEYRAKVLGAVRGARATPARQFAIYGPAEEAADLSREPVTAGVRPLARSPGWGLAPAALMALCLASYGAYFARGERSKWDLREAAVQWSVGRDISLPWRFTTAAHDFREAVAATEPWARELWTGAAGRAASLRPSGDALSVGQGLSLLKSTLPSAGGLDDAIAQYRTVLDGARLNLLADIQPGGQAYRGFQVAPESGALTVFFLEKRSGAVAETAVRVARLPVSPAATLHDLGLSRDSDGFFTLYRNREVVATWPKRPEQARRWVAGAFGLESRGRGRVQLYRWSLSGVRRTEESAGFVAGRARWFAFAAPR